MKRYLLALSVSVFAMAIGMKGAPADVLEVSVPLDLLYGLQPLKDRI